MLLRERETPEGLLVSICDSDCLGETYEDGDINLEVTTEFYGGEEATEADADAVVDALQRADVANLVGSESVEVAIEAGLIDGERVLEVAETKHAQLMWL
ncbi:DUF424 domain-containing protein [Halonotius terrestris]|uniref:DUF424 domain-containing protein n=1 Tax=Halonotius terrestris TaxID=2487750 RepID=A0A8J8P8X4_9EURY|nr:DUF424 family protein [Halonotius terrestris]TQQ81184.1 DUF424 domain-containing protein [Halonotius terrestris]